jgi:hypothetical protein
MATVTCLDDLRGADYQNRGCDFSAVWGACESPVFRVVDEEGNHVGEARARHFSGYHWLYVDDQSGYQVMHDEEVRHLILEAE